MGARLYRKMVRDVSASSRSRGLEPLLTGTTVLPMWLWLRPVVLHVTMGRALSHQSDYVCGVACAAHAGRHKSGDKGNVASLRGAGRHGSLGQLQRALCRGAGVRKLVLEGCVSPRLTRTIRSCRRLLRHMLIHATHIMLRMALFQRSLLHRWGIPRLHHHVNPPQLPTARPLLLLPSYHKRRRPLVMRTQHQFTPLRSVCYLHARERGSTSVSLRDVLENLSSEARTAPPAHSLTA